MFIVNSKVKFSTSHAPYFRVIQTVTKTDDKSYVRVFKDCSRFCTRNEAQEAIPELDRDLLESLEMRIL